MATKYSDIIELKDSRAAYNIQEEGPTDWMTFIANDQFNDILKKVVSSVYNNDADKHKAFWLSGTYGTGKSHAGAVIKHLLCDPVDNIKQYIEDQYSEDKYEGLRESIFDLRSKKRLLPVNMYGMQDIAHEEDLSLQIQLEVKKALKNAGIDIIVRTDFDNLIKHIDEQPSFWENLIENNGQLKSVAPDLKKLKSELTLGDTDVLIRVRTALRDGKFYIRLENADLKQWLFEIQNELKADTSNDYDGFLIIWDEFTEILTSAIGMRLLVPLQKISEAMMKPENDSYFLFISHPSALLSLKEEEREKTKDRYHYFSYNMEPVSAFKIMSSKFHIKDKVEHDFLSRNFIASNMDLYTMLSQNSTDKDETLRDLIDLFPLHPTTANLAAYYAREAGSSSRSVFEFLASDTIHKFLDSEIRFQNKETVTADYLWDYVLDAFDQDTPRFGAVTERYNSYQLQVEHKGKEYFSVFKGILLLNALNNIANNTTVTPTEDNIRMLFAGTSIQDYLTEILGFFNEKSIIQKVPGGLYSIQFSALPGDEIEKIKDELRSTNFPHTDQVINFGGVAEKEFATYIKGVSREHYYKFYSLQANKYTLLSKVESSIREARSYELIFAFFIAKDHNEYSELLDIAEEAAKEERFQNVSFFVFDAVLEEKNYDRFIEYQANATCAQRHGLADQQKTFEKNATEMVKEWVVKIRMGNAAIFLREKKSTVATRKLVSFINSSVAPAIFNKGPESLQIIQLKNSNTYWKKASVKQTVDIVLGYNIKEDIIKACNGQAKHVEYLLQDSVDDNLQFKSDCDPNHPLKLVCNYIDNAFKHTNKNSTFNLGEKLKGLTEPPYGLYQSYAGMAMVAFAMRKYVKQIFDTNGKPREQQHLVDDVVELFKAWENDKESNKLNFMFESKEAGDLCKRLVKLFSLNKIKNYSDISSLTDARWALIEMCNEKGFPLWSLKYYETASPEMGKLIDNIQKVCEPDGVKNPSLLKDTVEGLKALNLDIPNLLSIDNVYKKGFGNFLRNVEKVNFQNNEFGNAYAWLKGHLQGEMSWKEQDVIDQLKNWRLSQVVTPMPPTPPVPPVAESINEPDPKLTVHRSQTAEKIKRLTDDQCMGLMKKLYEEDNDLYIKLLTSICNQSDNDKLNEIDAYVQGI